MNLMHYTNSEKVTAVIPRAESVGVTTSNPVLEHGAW
jgi:hypothetical protein